MTLHHSPHVAHLPCSLRGKGQSKKRRSACVPTGNFQGNRQRKKYAPCHPLVAACGTSDAVWNNFFNVRAIVILSSHPPVVSYLPYIQSQIIQVNKRLVVSDQWDVLRWNPLSTFMNVISWWDLCGSVWTLPASQSGTDLCNPFASQVSLWKKNTFFSKLVK